jgi:hypothetical protein
MRRLLLPAACAALLIPLFTLARAADPEPGGANPDAAIQRLDKAVQNTEKDGREKAEKLRKQLLDRLKKQHAGLKGRKEKEARELNDRIQLIESLLPAQGLDTKLSVPKLLDKASSSGKYRELLHVLYLPQDKASYQEFSDYGHYTGTAYAGYNNLTPGYWVYVYPRWYIWKEPKP